MANKELSRAALLVKLNLVARYGYYSDERPVVSFIEDEQCYVVSWEGGPFDWATNDPYWLHEEIVPMMKEFKVDTRYNAEEYEPYFDELPGFYYEPVTGSQLSIRES